MTLKSTGSCVKLFQTCHDDGKTMQSLGVLGVGELTEKVVKGLRNSGYAGQINLSPRNQQRALALGSQYGCEVMVSNQAVVDRSEVLMLGVRPDAVERLSEEVVMGPGKTLISLVAGMQIAELSRCFHGASVVRVMLSCAAEINRTTVVIYPANAAVQQCLSALGTVIVLADESAFETATVAACMNGWFYFWLHELQQWFVDQGLPEGQARKLLLSNLEDCLSSAKHDLKTPLASMGSAIATPGTFTAKGLEMLEKQNFSAPWTHAFDAVLKDLIADSKQR
nr:hypothetical protein FFPRI1PSEUD_39830 [Pseudomonas sp. FFPRI_1]